VPVQNRKAAKYIRCVIPTDLQTRLGRGEIVRSLRTRSHREAVARWHIVEHGIRLAFDEARRDPMVDRKKLDELVDRLTDVAVARTEATLGIGSRVAPDPAREWAEAVARRNAAKAAATERPQVAPKAAPAGPLLSEAVGRYASFKKAQGAWTDKSAQLFTALLQELVEIVGDRELSTFTKADLLRYYEALPRLPSNAAKKWPELDARAVLDATAALDVDRLAPKSINKRLSAVKSFIGWAVDADLLSTNLGTILKPVPEGDARQARLPLSDAEVRAFVAKCDEDARDEAHRLVPLLCAYSGLRLNEAAQLDRDDIREVEGVWVCDINGDGDKELKTPTAKRLVPIHSSILPSILAYRETVHRGNLWGIQKGRDGHSGPLSKWFARRLDAVVDDQRKTFHSLRHSVATKLKGQGVEEYLIEGLLGHTSRSMSTGRYGKAAPVETMRSVVERIEYSETQR
jgi:integrase